MNQPHYHNTTVHEEPELARRQYKAHSLEQKILTWFKSRPGEKYTPWEVLDNVEGSLITSVRRALSNLVRDKYLKDTRFTPERKMERQGDYNYMWYYPAPIKIGEHGQV